MPEVEIVGVFDLIALRSCIADWLHIPAVDVELIDVVLATYMSNDMSGDPLWIILVDASGGGKTELLRQLRPLPNAYFVSTLTEKTLVSGYRDPNNRTKDPSLLPELNEKVLIIKDLSPLLSMRRASRSIIVGDLRDNYDGFSSQGRGNVGMTNYDVRFTFIAASTLAVDNFDAVDGELGERCLKARSRGNDNRSKVEQAIRNVGKDDGMRDIAQRQMSDFINSIHVPQCIEVPEVLLPSLVSIADFTATARSHVPRDKQHNMKYRPRPEVGTRLGKELAKLLIALALVRGKSKPGIDELRTVIRVAEDCLPPNRLLVLRELNCTAGLNTADVARRAELPRSTTVGVLDDLQVLKIVEKIEIIQDESFWMIAKPWREQLENIPILWPLC